MKNQYTKIHFAGILYGEKIKRQIPENTNSYAIQKYNKNLVNALKQKYRISVISPVRCNQRVIKKEINDNIEYQYINYYGKSGRIKLLFKSFMNGIKLRQEIIIADALNISIACGLSLAKRISKSKIILTVTDIPDDVIRNKKTIYAGLFKKNLQAADGFIFLTELANRDFNKENKPYVIVEGIVDDKEIWRRAVGKKICVYAGGLVEKYYIKRMIEAFDRVAKEDECLYIFGDGDCKEYVEKKSKDSNNIKYMGTVDNETVMQYEVSAELLINPRPNLGEYTKYSFPSKLIEYMNTGTPALVNRLDGIPDEYYDVVLLFSGDRLSDYEKSIRRALDLSDAEKFEIGERAREFIQKRNGKVNALNKIEELLNKV